VPGFPETLVERATVLGQAVDFDPVRWKARLPDPSVWPVALDGRPMGKKWPSVDRSAVFDICASATTAPGAVQAYVAAAVWGTGTSAQSVERRINVLTGNPDGAVGERIARAIEILHEKGAVAAYAALRSGPLSVNYLGPAFFSKLLYFAGFDSAAGDLRPLIIDRWIARAVNDWKHTSWEETNWPTEVYQRYLTWAAQLAADRGVSADVVEYHLFAAGKAGRAPAPKPATPTKTTKAAASSAAKATAPRVAKAPGRAARAATARISP
jgi:8-oxoguanine DNA glycosylase-like protein